MSYILDALKKSDAERRSVAATAGGAGAVYIVDAVEPAAWKRPALLGLLFLGAAALAFLWWPRGSDNSGTPPGPVAGPSAMPPLAVTSPDVGPGTPAATATVSPVAPPPLARTEVRTEARVEARVEPRSEPRAEPRPEPRRKVASVPRPAHRDVVAMPVARSAPPPQPASTPTSDRLATASRATVISREPGVAGTSGSARGAGEGVPAAPALTAAPVSAATAVAAVPPSADPGAPRNGAVVASADLPAALRNELPRLTVSGFAGGDDREARFAVINDRIVREGEEFAPGLRLSQVGQDGVVVEYRGTRFRP